MLGTWTLGKYQFVIQRLRQRTRSLFVVPRFLRRVLSKNKLAAQIRRTHEPFADVCFALLLAFPVMLVCYMSDFTEI